MKTEAEKAWEEKAAKLTEILPCSNYSCGMREYEVTEKLIELLSDFKASLRERLGLLEDIALSNSKVAVNNNRMENAQYWSGQKDSYKHILELLDTVKPKIE